MIEISQPSQFDEVIKNHSIVIGYFSTDECNVCKVLKPKLIEFLNQQYPKVEFAYINISKLPEFQGNYMVFAVPTLNIFVDGKEVKRFSRHFGISDLGNIIGRYYDIFFA